MSPRSVATEVAQTMKIVRVTATPLNIPLQISLPGIERKSSLEGCFVEVETDVGIVGHGLAAITRETVIAEIVNGVIAPAIKGDDPLASEAIWDKLYWTLTPRGQTGFGMQALSAVDIALWDIKGKAFRQPVWRLLGGARPRVPLYATFGFNFFDRDQLAAAAKLWVSQGYRRLKMVVGHEALRRREAQSALGRHPGGRGARARGARCSRAGHRAVHRRQLQSRSLSRRSPRGDGEALRDLVLRGANHPERCAADARDAARHRHGAGVRPERGPDLPLPRPPAARGG
jgi:L-alanine-DL-glutamate epimerase-like enolase superfamily enzyme